MTVFMNSRDAESNRIKPKIVSISVDESDFILSKSDLFDESPVDHVDAKSNLLKYKSLLIFL